MTSQVWSAFVWNSVWAFLFLIPLLLLIYFGLFKKKKASVFYSDLSVFLKSSSSLRVQLLFLPFCLKVISLFFLIIALARPQMIESLSRQTQEGLDIMLVMDTSMSMLIEDMDSKNPITRLEASKKMALEFIKERVFDRIGLIAFSGESFTKVPLTYDHELLERSLLELDVDVRVEQGTAIGVALANSLARLKSSPEKSRVIIFLTDGENNTGFIDPESSLELVKKNKIKVYTIGIGQKSGTFFVKYKVKDSRGNPFYRKARIQSHINTDLLKKIAKETHGKFFMANNIQSLQKVFNQINQLETYKIQVNSLTLYEEYFEDFLWLGFVLYFLSMFLSLSVFFRGV